MNANEPRFSSLSELLASIEDKPFDEAKNVVQDEYTTVSHLIKEIRRVHKVRWASQVNQKIAYYFEDLLCLLNTMDQLPFALDTDAYGPPNPSSSTTASIPFDCSERIDHARQVHTARLLTRPTS
jgi:hypothetical protein